MNSVKRILSIAFLTSVVCLQPASVNAQVRTESSEPSAGAVLRRAPRHLYVNLAEPPSKETGLTVTDGCQQEVPLELVVVEKTLHATMERGEPGRWSVQYEGSSLGGRAIDDSFSFRVRGQNDCADGPSASQKRSEGSANDNAQGDASGPEKEEGAIGSRTFVGILVLVSAALAFYVSSIVYPIIRRRAAG